jgi:hypothetical protein
MPTLAEFKAENPAYASTPDGELAYGLWNKSYKDQIAMGEFADQVSLSGEGFKRMIEFAKESGYEPTDRSYAPGYIPENSQLRSTFQGQTLGAGDEIMAGMMAGAAKLKGSEAPIGSLYDQALANERADLNQYKKVRPVESAAMELGGALISPINMIRGPAILAQAPGFIRGAIAAGTAGAGYGFMSGEGGLDKRAQNAVDVGIPSMIFGGALQPVANVIGKPGVKLFDSFSKSNKTPTLDNLRDTKNIAYAAVDAAGFKFTPKDMLSLFSKAVSSAKENNYVPEVDKQTLAALSIIKSLRGKTPTLGQLENVKQGLWKRYEASGRSEQSIRDTIDHIDELIAKDPTTSDLMAAARAANGRYKKTELLTEAFEKADRQAASTGSGGNVFNKYKQAVASILNNNNKSKWFNEEEVQQMAKFVEGNFSEGVIRQIGKLSPSGNGLMMALNVGAAVHNPAMLGVTAAGAGAKAIGDSGVVGRANDLVTMTATGRIPKPLYVPGVATAAASLGNQTTNFSDYLPFNALQGTGIAAVLRPQEAHKQAMTGIGGR